MLQDLIMNSLQGQQGVTRNYQRARMGAETPDIREMHRLNQQRHQYRGQHRQVADLRSRLQQVNDRGVRYTSQAEIDALDQEIQQISGQLGRNFDWRQNDSQGNLQSINMRDFDRSMSTLRRAGDRSGNRLNTHFTPEMRQQLGYNYLYGSEQNLREKISLSTNREMMDDLVGPGMDHAELDKILKDMGKSGPGKKDRWKAGITSGSETSAYEDLVDSFVNSEQAIFRSKLQERTEARAREIDKKFTDDLEKWDDDTQKLLDRWKKGSRDDYVKDIGTLRQKGFLDDEGVADALRDSSDPGRQEELARELAAINAGHYEDNPNFPYYDLNGDQGTGSARGAGAGLMGGAIGSSLSRFGINPSDYPALQAVGAGGKYAASKLGITGGGGGKLGGALKALGPASVAYFGLNAMTDLTTARGNTGAASITNAVQSMLPAVGAVGGLPGVAAGYLASKAIGPIMNPYIQTQAEQRRIESITGENLQGEGAQNNFARAYDTMIPQEILGLGSMNMDEAMNSARLKNPLVDPAQIDALAESMLLLGESTDDVTTRIEPLTRTLAETNVNPELIALFDKIGQGTGGLGGPAFADLTANRIQNAAGNGFTQQDVEGYVQNAIQTLGPTIGYENAPGVALGYANAFSAGGSETDMLFQQTGMVNNLMQSDAGLAMDPQSLMFMGLDPNSTFDTADVAGQRVSMAKELVANLEKGEDGKLTPYSKYVLNGYITSPAYAQTFAGMDVNQVEAMGLDENITPEGVTQDMKEEEEAREKAIQREKDLARGIGEDAKWSDYANAGMSGATFFPGQRHAHNLYEGSEEVAKKGVGAVGSFAARNKRLDAKDVMLAGGGNLADSMDDPAMIKALNSGKQKINVQGQEMTIAEFNEAQLRGEASYNKTDGLTLTPEGSQSTQQIGLSDEARRWFKIEDVRDPQSVGGKVNRAQNEHKVNSGMSMAQGTPTYG